MRFIINRCHGELRLELPEHLKQVQAAALEDLAKERIHLENNVLVPRTLNER